MLDLSKHRIQIRNGNGRLVGAGFSWPEPRLHRYHRVGFQIAACMTLAGTFIIAAIIAAFVHAGWAIAFSLVAGLSLYGLFALKRMDPMYLHQDRALVFCADGRILVKKNTPFRKPYAEYGEVAHPHTEISSIEAHNRPVSEAGFAGFAGVATFGCEVDLFFEDGTAVSPWFHLSDRGVAGIIAIQLQHALRDIRLAVSHMSEEEYLLAHNALNEGLAKFEEDHHPYWKFRE
jgi:hypothetical protein